MAIKLVDSPIKHGDFPQLRWFTRGDWYVLFFFFVYSIRVPVDFHPSVSELSGRLTSLWRSHPPCACWSHHKIPWKITYVSYWIPLDPIPLDPINHHVYWIWENVNISLTWIKAIWGWFPLLTMIPVRSQWGRYNLPRSITISIECSIAMLFFLIESLWKIMDWKSVGIIFHSQLFLESHSNFHGSSHHPANILLFQLLSIINHRLTID